MSCSNCSPSNKIAAWAEHCRDLESRLERLEWSDRITFRHGADGEIILRVPRQDEDGNKSAVNHVLTVRQACTLGDELAEALLENAENSRRRADEIKRGFCTANNAVRGAAQPRTLDGLVGGLNQEDT